MPFALLLAMQAAGMIFDYIGTRNQAEWNNLGAKAEQAGFEANLYQTRLEAEDESLNAMKTLRQNMGSQIATMAARGTAMGAGSALTGMFESVSNFDSDERTRRINLLGKENQIRGQSAISKLNNYSNNSKLWNGFAGRTINRFPTSASGWKQGAKDFSEGFGLSKSGGAQ